MINYWCYDYHTNPEWEYKLWLLKGETCLHQEGEKMVGTKALENKNSRMYLVDKKSNGYVDKRVDVYPDYKEIEKARMIDVDVIDSPKKPRISTKELSLLCVSVGFLALCISPLIKNISSIPATGTGVISSSEGITNDNTEVLGMESIDAILKVVNQRAAEEDYRGAIDILQAAIDNGSTDMALLNRIDELKAEYKSQLVSEARSVADTEGYIRGSEVLRSGLGLFKDDPEYESILGAYVEKIPMNLSDMEPYSVNKVASVEGDYCTDNYGNTYDSVICNRSNFFSEEKTGVVTYLLPENEYDTLSGSIYIPYEARTDTDTVFGELIEIYGDDNVCLWQGKPIHGTDKPYNFEIPISGVEFLQFRIEGINFVGDGSPAYPTLCFGNLRLSKS